MIQLYAGFDIPAKSAVVSPVGAPKPNLDTIPIVGIRVVFDWRYYLN
jgi:hypothetical protein